MLPVFIARNFNEPFLGFETDIYGLVKTIIDGKLRHYVDFVR